MAHASLLCQVSTMDYPIVTLCVSLVHSWATADCSGASAHAEPVIKPGLS